MKKWIFSAALMFSMSLASAHNQDMMHDHEDHAPQVFNPSEASYLAPEFVYNEVLKVVPMQVRGFDGKSKDKLIEAFELLETVVNSAEFKERVINFKNDQGNRSFASNKGLSNEEIFQVFMSGKELLQPETTGEMNFYLKLYYRPWSKVIGYTSGNTNLININWRFFKKFTPDQVASNLAHEWTHKIGFDHTSAAEHDSAPYAIGYIVGDIARKILNQNK